MNTSSSTLIEQLEDERSLTDSLINELLLLRQKLNITQHKDDTFDSDMIHEISKRLDALEMRVLRIEKKSIPRDWNLYKVIWRLDQFSDIFQNAEKYEKSLSHVRAPYCDPNSLKDVCSPIFFSQPLGTPFIYELTLMASTLPKGNTCQYAWLCVREPTMRYSLGPSKALSRYTSLVKAIFTNPTNSSL